MIYVVFFFKTCIITDKTCMKIFLYQNKYIFLQLIAFLYTLFYILFGKYDFVNCLQLSKQNCVGKGVLLKKKLDSASYLKSSYCNSLLLHTTDKNNGSLIEVQFQKQRVKLSILRNDSLLVTKTTKIFSLPFCFCSSAKSSLTTGPDTRWVLLPMTTIALIPKASLHSKNQNILFKTF